MTNCGRALAIPGGHAAIMNAVEIVQGWIVIDPAMRKARADRVYGLEKVLHAAFTSAECWEEIRTMVPWLLTRPAYDDLRQTLVPLLVAARPDAWGWLAPVGATPFTGVGVSLAAVQWALHIAVIIAAREHSGTRAANRLS